MNGIEPAPTERGRSSSCWKHPDPDWCNAVEIVGSADTGWGVWFWQIVTSGGVIRKADGPNKTLYNWSERVLFPTREEAEHYAQVVYDMKLYD